VLPLRLELELVQESVLEQGLEPELERIPVSVVDGLVGKCDDDVRRDVNGGVVK